MSLSCECSDYDWESDGWAYRVPYDFDTLRTKRRRRCQSCKTLIDIGSPCVAFDRHRYPQDDIEERIWGEGTEISLATWYMCEECGGLFLSLEDLGFCIDIERDNMHELLEEYHEHFNPVKWEAPNDTKTNV